MSQEVRDQLRLVLPSIEKRASQAEKIRRTPDGNIEALETAGVFALMAPKENGGLEAPLDALIDAIVDVGTVCGSTSWVLCVYGSHIWMSGLFNSGIRKEMYADKNYVLYPMCCQLRGIARRQESGYSLNGKWPFATGCHHAQWALVSAQIEGGAPQDPATAYFLVPKEDIRVLDTWNGAGLKGSGSFDIQTENAWVPDARVVADLGPLYENSGKTNASALYRIPPNCVFSAVAAAPSVGIALGAVADFQKRAHQVREIGTGLVRAQNAAVQARYSRACALAHTAQQLLNATVAAITKRTTSASGFSDEFRMQVRRDCAFASELAKQSVLLVGEAAGASAQQRHAVMQRMVRDVLTVDAHMFHDMDLVHEMWGAKALGFEPQNAIF